MPGISQLVIGTAVALAMTVASVSVVGSAAAQEALINRYTSPVSETDFRLGEHQQLRRHFIGK